jgi:hypothetical protein
MTRHRGTPGIGRAAHRYRYRYRQAHPAPHCPPAFWPATGATRHPPKGPRPPRPRTWRLGCGRAFHRRRTAQSVIVRRRSPRSQPGEAPELGGGQAIRGSIGYRRHPPASAAVRNHQRLVYSVSRRWTRQAFRAAHLVLRHRRHAGTRNGQQSVTVICQLRQNESTKTHLNIPRAHRPQAPRSKDPGPFAFHARIRHPASGIPYPTTIRP